MRYKSLALAAVLALTGCHPGVTNIPVSRNSGMGQAIARMDATKKQYQQNVALYRKAMMNYEKAQGGKCGNILFSRLSQPIEVVGPRVRIHHLQGSSSGCGYQDYKVKIAYGDDEYFVVNGVEVLEKITK